MQKVISPAIPSRDAMAAGKGSWEECSGDTGGHSPGKYGKQIGLSVAMHGAVIEFGVN